MATAIVVIPARGGSKGLPTKNLHPLCGKVLIAWSIEQALAADIGSVIVVTDDDAIAAVADKYGVAVYEEPADLAGDNISMESVMGWVIEQCRQRSPQAVYAVPDWLFLLQCTSPLRLSSHIRECAAVAKTGAFNSVFSVVPSAHCCWRLKDKIPSGEWPQASPLKRMTRQEAGQQWTENGAIYAFKAERFLVEETRFIPPMYLYEMPGWTAMQVDSPEDLALVEHVMRTRLTLGADGVRA